MARLVVVALLALLPCALPAQVVRGRVLDAEAGEPARGAVVSLLTADGRRVAPALVDESGGYLVVAPGPGEYRARVDLIGYEAWVSGPLLLTSADTVMHDVRLPLRRVQLASVTVEGTTRCETRPDQVPRTVALWEQIRRALAISEITSRRGLVPLDLVVVEEQRSGNRVTHRGRHRSRASSVRPWSARPAAEVVEHGFVVRVDREFEFIGPDVPILLSSEFLGTHCFRPVRDGATAHAIGLAFEPVPGRDVPDVRGTIWLDERTAELRRVEFEFVNLTFAQRANGDVAGHLAFSRMPTGEWYVHRWEIESRRWVRGRQTVRRAMGDATPVGAATTARLPATLRGTVTDSTVGEGLAGATVLVPGVEPVVSDSLGRFAVTVANLPEDSLDVVVQVDHPRLATVGLATVEHTVRLRAGATATLEVSTPSVPTLLGALCPLDGRAVVDERGVLRLGMVSGRAIAADGAPLPEGSRVVAEWPSEERLGEGAAARTVRSAQTLRGTDGQFRICPVPLGSSLQLYAEVDGLAGPRTEVVLPSSGVAQVDVTFARETP